MKTKNSKLFEHNLKREITLFFRFPDYLFINLLLHKNKVAHI